MGRVVVLDRGLCRADARVLQFLSGAAILSFALFWTVLFNIAFWQTFATLGVVAFGLRLALPRLSFSPCTPVSRSVLVGYGLVFSAFALYYFIHAMKPEASPDGATYHLGWVTRTLRSHGFDKTPENIYWAFPKGLEMLYLVAFAFGRHSAAALTHFAFLIALGLGIFAYARSRGEPLAGVFGSLLFFLSPAVAQNGTTAYADVALAAGGFGAFWATDLWRRKPSARMLATAGLLAGFSFAIKYTGMIVVLYVVVSALLSSPRVRTLVVALGPAIALIAPYLVWNYAIFGNPVLPFLNAWFPNRFVHLSFERMAREMMQVYPGLSSWWQWPWEAAVRGGVLQGFLGPVFLLLPLSIFALRDKLGRALLVVGFVFAIPITGNMGTRFILPALPFFSLALGLVISRWPGALCLVLAVHVVTVLPPVARQYVAQGAPMLEGLPIREALRIRAEEDTLHSLAESYDVASMIEKHVSSNETVLALAWVMEAYTTPTIRTHHLSASNERLAETLWTAVTPELQPGQQLIFRFSPIHAKAIRIVQEVNVRAESVVRRDAPGFILNRPRIHRDQWGIAEMRVFYEEKELPRSNKWQVYAWPNRWDAPLAFDRNPTTAWKTWEPARAGMFLELDFGELQSIDALSLSSPSAQHTLAFRLEFQEPAGGWRSLAAELEHRDASLPHNQLHNQPYNLRQFATAALRREGIRYVVVDPSLYAASEFQDNPQAWGMQFVAEATNRVRLYRLANPE